MHLLKPDTFLPCFFADSSIFSLLGNILINKEAKKYPKMPPIVLSIKSSTSNNL